MNWKKALLVVGILLVVLIASAAIIMYPTYRALFNQADIPMDKNLTVVTGGGGNSGILVTEKAIVVIDTKMGPDAGKLYKTVMAKAGSKPVIVINTHYHGDHTSGNHFYKGDKIYMGAYDKAFLAGELTPDNMPTDYITDSLVLNLGDEVVEIYNLGQGHTWDDMVVYLKNRKILFSGDLIFNNINPFLIKKSGASVIKWVADLDNILNRWDITTIVPGHGETGGKQIARTMKEYFTDMSAVSEDPAKETEIFAKYKDWVVTPTMTSPAITVEFIRNSEVNNP
jgi:cyclase